MTKKPPRVPLTDPFDSEDYLEGFRAGLSRGLELAKEHAQTSDCGACDGTGQVKTGPRMQDTEDCSDCDGRGREIVWLKADEAVAKEGK